jgi:hypothetical protein
MRSWKLSLAALTLVIGAVTMISSCTQTQPDTTSDPLTDARQALLRLNVEDLQGHWMESYRVWSDGTLLFADEDKSASMVYFLRYDRERTVVTQYQRQGDLLRTIWSATYRQLPFIQYGQFFCRSNRPIRRGTSSGETILTLLAVAPSLQRGHRIPLRGGFVYYHAHPDDLSHKSVWAESWCRGRLLADGSSYSVENTKGLTLSRIGIFYWDSLMPIN